jgi:hypothetical protein
MDPTCIEIDCSNTCTKGNNTRGEYFIKYCEYHYRLHCAENGRKGGRAKPQRRPDRYTNSYGYVLVKDSSGTKFEHRKVMAEMLGRELRPGESVHHKNGVRADNRKENLELWIGPIRKGQRASDMVCPHCHKPYL